jgi:hypothetical protein
VQSLDASLKRLHEFLTDARWLVFGETFPLIDNHRA